jgi:CRP-like cAMP-binding protein
MGDPKETVFGMGQELFRQGEKGGELYFIKSGEVELTVRNEETSDEAVVGLKVAREVLGTMSFLDNSLRTATAKAKTEVSAVVVNQAQREKLLTSIPQWAGVLMKDLSGSLKHMNDEFAHLTVENEKLNKRIENLKNKVTELEAPKK